MAAVEPIAFPRQISLVRQSHRSRDSFGSVFYRPSQRAGFHISLSPSSLFYVCLLLVHIYLTYMASLHVPMPVSLSFFLSFPSFFTPYFCVCSFRRGFASTCTIFRGSVFSFALTPRMICFYLPRPYYRPSYASTATVLGNRQTHACVQPRKKIDEKLLFKWSGGSSRHQVQETADWVALRSKCLGIPVSWVTSVTRETSMTLSGEIVVLQGEQANDIAWTCYYATASTFSALGYTSHTTPNESASMTANSLGSAFVLMGTRRT